MVGGVGDGVCRGPCRRSGVKLNGAGLCTRCYMREYRKLRKQRDPTYRPWESKNRTRITLSISRAGKALLDAIPEGVRSGVIDQLLHTAFRGVALVVDRSGIFISNGGAENAAFGYASPGELVGVSVFERYRDHPNMLAAVQAALEGDYVAGVFRFRRHDWAMRWSPILDASGGVVAAVGVGYAVTNRHS